MCEFFPCIPILRVLFFYKNVLRDRKLKFLYETYLLVSCNINYSERTGLQELTKHIGSLKLKEHICLLGLIGGKGLQKLTGHKGLLEFRYTDNNGGN